MDKWKTVRRLNMTKETYVETIHDLIHKHGYAAVTDIAKTLNVKPPSVTEMLKKLDALGFVEYTPYRNVSLTKKGETLSIFLKQTEKSLQNFLKLLGVDERIAHEDACKLEHVLNGLTLERLAEFLSYVQNTPYGHTCIGNFKSYRTTKEYCLLNEQNP